MGPNSADGTPDGGAIGALVQDERQVLCEQSLVDTAMLVYLSKSTNQHGRTGIVKLTISTLIG